MADAIAYRPGPLQTWFQPPAPSKRKRDDAGDTEASSLHDVSREEKTNEQPAKKRQTKAAPKPAPAKSTNMTKEAKKLYTETLKIVETRYIELDKKVKAMSPNSRAITISNYATSAAKHLNTAKKLAGMGETVLAFNFVMALGDASHRRISTWKMSGESGDCDDQFVRLDEALPALIEKRETPASRVDELPVVPHRWTDDDADVGPFKTSNGPNKQQRGQMDRQYIDWEKKRREARRARRETCEDWEAVALSDLVGDRKYLAGYGVGEDFHARESEKQPNSYFGKSIAKLEELNAARSGAE
ncbi:hypothetical protein LTR36_010358 [Oleoguttula mirabilis]|uniref:Uncharacterized protein n=1 Tax=Oleoguttula mirabilis TaxID=1507867 RepID=A0AAV9J550_9PEZI|nr:hypothetical protein LTR36_010358 [Oleoguttula mirabilis]